MSEWIYGIHTVHELFKDDPESFLRVYVVKGRLNSRLRSLVYEISMYGFLIQYRERHWLNNIVKNSVHQGIVVQILHKNFYFQENDIPDLLTPFNMPLILVLDTVTDPRNLGACLRCAVAFGVNMVVVPRYRSSGLNSTVRKVSSGMADKIPFVRVINLVRTLIFLKTFNIRIIGTILEGQYSIFQASLVGGLAIVIGSENSGLRRLTRESCDELITIPMINQVTSLNVSVAAGICLFEVLRQRHKVQYL